MNSQELYEYLINHPKGPRGGLIAKFPAIKVLENLDGLKENLVLKKIPENGRIDPSKFYYETRASDEDVYKNLEDVLTEKGVLIEEHIVRHPKIANYGQPKEHKSTLFYALYPEYDEGDIKYNGLKKIEIDLKVYNPEYKP